MGKISTYITDTNVVGADKWIGSDSQNYWQTKNFTAQDVANFINKVGAESQLLRYVYDIYAQGDPAPAVREPASISFLNGGASTVALNSITEVMLSKYAMNQQEAQLNVSTWYNSPLTGSEILLTQCDDITQWAIYKWTGSSLSASDNNFYDVTLTYIAGNGSLTQDKDYFISLLTYNVANSGDKNAVSIQLTGSNTYTVTHNLEKYPAVSVSLGSPANPTNLVDCEVEYLSINQVKLDFTNNFTGVAIFN